MMIVEKRREQSDAALETNPLQTPAQVQTKDPVTNMMQIIFQFLHIRINAAVWGQVSWLACLKQESFEKQAF